MFRGMATITAKGHPLHSGELRKEVTRSTQI